MERASLDVELGKRFRQMKTHMSANETLARKSTGQAASTRPSDNAKVCFPSLFTGSSE